MREGILTELSNLMKVLTRIVAQKAQNCLAGKSRELQLQGL